jgi:hypothetical protein
MRRPHLEGPASGIAPDRVADGARPTQPGSAPRLTSDRTTSEIVSDCAARSLGLIAASTSGARWMHQQAVAAPTRRRAPGVSRRTEPGHPESVDSRPRRRGSLAAPNAPPAGTRASGQLPAARRAGAGRTRAIRETRAGTARVRARSRLAVPLQGHLPRSGQAFCSTAAGRARDRDSRLQTSQRAAPGGSAARASGQRPDRRESVGSRLGEWRSQARRRMAAARPRPFRARPSAPGERVRTRAGAWAQWARKTPPVRGGGFPRGAGADCRPAPTPAGISSP